MLNEIDVKDILFLDIETVPQYPDFEKVEDKFVALWDKKSSHFRSEEQTAADVYERAGIYAEFGKIICISVGIINQQNNIRKLRLKSYADDDEKKLLQEFGEMLEKYSADHTVYLCAHNGKEFDFPYIARRMLINGLSLPEVLNLAGRKPWEVRHLDTMELWKFGDYKHYTSLELLTAVFSIPSPKDDIDGSMVAVTYWQQNDLKRIVEYCQNDVIAVTQLLLRYKGLALIDTENIEIADQN